MKNNHAASELRAFYENWSIEDSYYVWGASNTARHFCSALGAELKIVGFIDSDSTKWGTSFLGRPILAPQEVLLQPKHRIIVASLAYWQILETLQQSGLQENIDFCDSKVFEGVYFYYRYQEIHVHRTDLSITSFCNLKCKYCNMLMPYYKKHAHRTLEEIKRDMAAYFQWVDRVQILDILGGEPFLHPQLSAILSHIADVYAGRMEQIVIFTNGTLLPPDEVLQVMRDFNVLVQISDYRVGLPDVSDQTDRLISILKNLKIAYRVEQMEHWLDFGLTSGQKKECSEEELSTFFRRCAPPFRGLQEQKYYYCHLSASAVNAGFLKDNPNDFFALEPYDGSRREAFLAFDLGYLDKGYVTYCKMCNGCGSVNQSLTSVAEQLK